MAEAGSWTEIMRRGLLSTTAALDLFEVGGAQRIDLESRHRPDKRALAHASHGRLVLRDQKPMSDKRLQMCLKDGLSPTDWYRIINSKTFFWVSRQRLIGLLGARAYRNDEHDVLTVDTQSLLYFYAERTSLCHINSGNTFPIPQPRGADTFKRIVDYPSDNGRPKKEVVELVVDYSVPDIATHVLCVERMKPDVVLDVLWRRP